MSSEINICLNCGKIQDYIEYKNRRSSVYDKFRFVPTNDYSECMTCGKESIIQVDEEIAPYIFALNKLGFTTKFCCAGHTTTNYDTAYIVFNCDFVSIFTQLYSEFIQIHPELDNLEIENFNCGTRIAINIVKDYYREGITLPEEIINYHCYINKRCMLYKKSFYSFLDYIIENENRVTEIHMSNKNQVREDN